MSEHPLTGDWGPHANVGLPERPTLPGYEVLEELGRGGMGVVYKARQVLLKRLVALKMIRDSALAGPQERARFRIEAQAAARMRHPNIVQIYDVGDHAGRPYFAMELVEGGRLDRYLGGGAQPPSLAAELVRTLAQAVQHAHEQKVVHRDLKPANILLAVESSSLAPRPSSLTPLFPKISDFGLAKRLDTDSTAWTQDGAVLGTASYMAPEQAAGRVQAVGPAVDIYGLGAILYELLVGRPPFQGDSWQHTVRQVLYDEPVPPARVLGEVPRDLDTICLKCLEKEPQRRYQTAQELAEDLARFLEGKPVAAVRLGSLERLQRLADKDGYEIVAEIGRGPRSTVYRARYTPLNQPVALKVFTSAACTRQEWEARLRRGAELWAAVGHPHVVPVHRAGWWDDAPYLVSDYLPQGSLADRLDGRPYAVQHALRIVELLAEVITYLHRQGVVHGNLKPSNVLLAADGIPRVADFRLTGGLFQGPLTTDLRDTAALRYLAPEVVADPAADARPYTDIYGLGVILYELLTGRPPFGGSSAQEILEQVRTQDPLPPSQLNAEVTPYLEQISRRCLRKNPWRRYSRAYNLQMQLRQLLEKLEGGDVPGQRQGER
jgi:serine/threonine protein kinase